MEEIKGIKTGGRVKGTPNKVSAQQRKLLATFMEEEFPTFVKKYRSLDAADQVRAYVQMLPYVTPKLQAVQMDLEAKKTDSVDAELRKLTIEFDAN